MQPETHESYLPDDSNPLFSHGSDSGQRENALMLLLFNNLFSAASVTNLAKA